MVADALQRVFKTLTDPTRMRILFLLEREELAVQELCQILDIAQSTVSRHLGILRDTGLLVDRREGTSNYYRYAPPSKGRTVDERDGPPDATDRAETDRAVTDWAGTDWAGTGSAGTGSAGTEWAETWDLARRSLNTDPAIAKDLASLDFVLRQREVRSRRWFEQVGPEWDDIRRVFNDDVHRARAMCRLIDTRLCVADIGTGTGILARELAATGVRVIAIDRSERMLESARKSLHGKTDDAIEFRVGEANALPVADDEVDAAMAHMVLHYIASPAEVVTEMARIVRPGGRVVVVDFVQHEHEWMKQELGVLWQGFAPDAISRWFDDAGLTDVAITVDEEPSRSGAELPHTFIASATRPRTHT